ncbi:MAG: TraR/DksA C4-type zinc finger protein [Anaerolineales bacterium]|nr:TraR/DksA C4-type zinc finger protein [Anaerolineales bacterium]
MPTLAELLETSSAQHRHLCPRQVLGVRMGLYAGELLGLALPQTDKRLYTFVETDGCGADGISVATNCWIGRRTLHVEDLGKVAATFVDTLTGRTLRLAPRADVRQAARALAPEARNPWEAQLLGYQRLPAAAMFSVQPVRLTTPVEAYLSHAGHRVQCARCGEEVMNEREVELNGVALCRTCAGPAYYAPVEAEAPTPAAFLQLGAAISS